MQPVSSVSARALAALRENLPRLAASCLGLDRDGAFPDEALDLLAADGMLQAFGATVPPLDLMEALRLVGRTNLSLGRIFEGHVNAALLIGWYGTAAQRGSLAGWLEEGRVLGVWNTEAAPLTITSTGALVGGKTYCSGAGHIDLAIVTARNSAGDKQMVIAPAADPARVAPGSWNVGAMKATASGAYDLTDLPATGEALLGAPGDYEREPRFSGGAWRFCAVQLGGVERIVQLLRAHLAGSVAGENAVQRARFAHAYAAVRSAGLWVREAAQRAERADAGPEAIAMVQFARGVVEEAALLAIEAAQRGVGTRAFFSDHPLDAACRDLAFYLRQPSPDLARDRAAAATLESDMWTDDPLW